MIEKLKELEAEIKALTESCHEIDNAIDDKHKEVQKILAMTLKASGTLSTLEWVETGGTWLVSAPITKDAIKGFADLLGGFRDTFHEGFVNERIMLPCGISVNVSLRAESKDAITITSHGGYQSTDQAIKYFGLDVSAVSSRINQKIDKYKKQIKLLEEELEVNKCLLK